jgi:hypothetical protein
LNSLDSNFFNSLLTKRPRQNKKRGRAVSLSDTARPFFSKHLPAVFIPSAMVTLREIPTQKLSGNFSLLPPV